MLPLITKAQSTWLSFEHGVRKLIFAKDGATAIEYGLIAAGIAVAIIAAVFALGDELETFINGVTTQLNAKQPG
jgi:pilus assembly protein Flp/PilA